MSYICDYFSIEELVPEYTLKAMFKAGADPWLLFDDRVLWTADELRKRYGTAFINDWPFGGYHHHRGYRPFDCKDGAEYSQHKFGRAFDVTFYNVKADEIRDDIRNTPSMRVFQYIRRVEDNVGWLHYDIANSLGMVRFF